MTYCLLLLGSRLARLDPYLASGKMGRYDPRHNGNSRGFPGDFRGTMKDSARVGFGDFVLDGGTRQLLRDGSERHLEPKAFALLELLVARRPAAVSKAEVRDRLWPDTFVSESTLTGRVAQVRRALDERGPDERYIRTVHGFGYAFVGPAATLDADPPPDGGLQPTTASAGAVARIIWDDRVFTLGP